MIHSVPLISNGRKKGLVPYVVVAYFRCFEIFKQFRLVVAYIFDRELRLKVLIVSHVSTT